MQIAMLCRQGGYKNETNERRKAPGRQDAARREPFLQGLHGKIRRFQIRMLQLGEGIQANQRNPPKSPHGGSRRHGPKRLRIDDKEPAPR